MKDTPKIVLNKGPELKYLLKLFTHTVIARKQWNRMTTAIFSVLMILQSKFNSNIAKQNLGEIILFTLYNCYV